MQLVHKTTETQIWNFIQPIKVPTFAFKIECKTTKPTIQPTKSNLVHKSKTTNWNKQDTFLNFLKERNFSKDLSSKLWRETAQWCFSSKWMQKKDSNAEKNTRMQKKKEKTPYIQHQWQSKLPVSSLSLCLSLCLSLHSYTENTMTRDKGKFRVSTDQRETDGVVISVSVCVCGEVVEICGGQSKKKESETKMQLFSSFSFLCARRWAMSSFRVRTPACGCSDLKSSKGWTRAMYWDLF